MNPRLRRLQADYELVREVFSGHPHVVLEPMGAHLPPESYRIAFRLRGLFLDGEQPAYREIHHVELMLPRGYPAERPYVVPVEPIFHPNIRDYFCIADYWAAGTTLADVIAKLGDMIQWRIYNVASPLDAIAARWAAEQEPTGIFPVGNVDLGVADFEISVRSRSPERNTQELAPLALGAASAVQGAPTEASRTAALETPQADDDGLVVLLRSQGS
jgi:ubiquitin-protein ligase